MRRYVQRAELALGLPDYKALASLGLSPDPLQQLASAMASVRTEDGEKAEAVFDLVPVSEQRLARLRWRLMARAARRGPSAPVFGRPSGPYPRSQATEIITAALRSVRGAQGRDGMSWGTHAPRAATQGDKGVDGRERPLDWQMEHVPRAEEGE